MQHLKIVYNGAVQGVGFRWTVKSLADSLGLVGWVRNQPDGTVEVMVHGSEDRVARLLEAIELRFAGHITEKKEKETCDLPTESSFEILR